MNLENMDFDKKSHMHYICLGCKHSIKVNIPADMIIYDVPFAVCCEKCGLPMVAMQWNNGEVPETLLRNRHIMEMGGDGKVRVKLVIESHPIVHGYMVYRCESCGTKFPIYLEKGIEELDDGEKHKPSPFTVPCPSCKEGIAMDISGLRKMFGLELIPYQYYFANIEGKECGKLMYYNGEGESVSV